MPRIGIVDTTFARCDMAAVAIETLRRDGERLNADIDVCRVTVPGIKDLPVACAGLLDAGCDLVLALGMVGRAPVDKMCGHEVSTALQQVMLAARRHVLEVFVHEDEARDDAELAHLCDARSREHAVNALWMLLAPHELRCRSGTGERQGFADVGRLPRVGEASAPESLVARVIEAVRTVQALPFVWPGPPEADAARRAGSGTCASKHALLAERLDALGVTSLPLLVVGPVVPAALADDPEFASGAGLLEVHECLTVLTSWAGPIRVDVTVDPPVAARGVPATLDWDGVSDMALAVDAPGPGWAAPRAELRAAKEHLRSRLYRTGGRERRDAILLRLSDRYAAWRGVQ